MPLLSDLIDLPPQPLISIVGAGGKTTTMYTLASELAQRGGRSINTTTTQIFFPRLGQTRTLIGAPDTPTLLAMISAACQRHPRVTMGRALIHAERIDP